MPRTWNTIFDAAIARGDDPFRAIDLADEWKMKNLQEQLNRATETIERQLQKINDLQDELSRRVIRGEEASGDIAARLVVEAVIEETKKHTGKFVQFTLSRDYFVTEYHTRFHVSIREVGDG